MDLNSKATGSLATSKDELHKQGAYKSKTGYSYEGDWKDNVKHGKGKFIYLDGKVYEGDFFNNKKEGRGMFAQQTNVPEWEEI